MTTIDVFFGSYGINNYCRDCGCSIPEDHTLCEWCGQMDYDEGDY